jgi:hypothetical protein
VTAILKIDRATFIFASVVVGAFAGLIDVAAALYVAPVALQAGVILFVNTISAGGIAYLNTESVKAPV